jgi:drug/metabolite transporter (DMT)-like permease
MKNSTWIESNKHYLALHAVIFIWGFTGILGKLISLPFYGIVWYRMLFAALGLLVYLILAKRKFESNPRKILSFLAVGFVVAAHWSTFFEALKVSNVSVVLTTLASTSLFVAFIEPLLYKRRIIAYEVLFGLAVIFGLYLIFNFETQYQWGIVLALISAFLAAIFGTLNGVLVRNSAPGQITLWEMIGGVVGMTLYTLIFEDLTWEAFSPNWLDTFYLLVLGLICTALAFVVSVQVMRILSPFTVSISINMEPIYAIILALLFFGESEQMTPGFYLGAAIILGTVIGNGVLKRYFRNKQRLGIEKG